MTIIGACDSTLVIELFMRLKDPIVLVYYGDTRLSARSTYCSSSSSIVPEEIQSRCLYKENTVFKCARAPTWLGSRKEPPKYI